VTERQSASADLGLVSAGLLLAGVLLGSFGQICMKLGLQGVPVVETSPGGTVLGALTWMLRPWVAAGLGLYATSTLIWLLIISRVRLSVAYPMISISYILVTVLSASVLHEKVAWPLAIPGLTCITLGVTLIGWRSS
jgi:drug/metabolite transporter (DMT)-like permease